MCVCLCVARLHNKNKNRAAVCDSTNQMWESSRMGSLDLVKKFFAMDPGNKYQHWKRLHMSFLVVKGAFSPYPGWGPPDQAADFWTGLCNTPAVPPWSSRGRCRSSPLQSAGPASLMSRSGTKDGMASTNLKKYFMVRKVKCTRAIEARSAAGLGG